MEIIPKLISALISHSVFSRDVGRTDIVKRTTVIYYKIQGFFVFETKFKMLVIFAIEKFASLDNLMLKLVLPGGLLIRDVSFLCGSSLLSNHGKVPFFSTRQLNAYTAADVTFEPYQALTKKSAGIFIRTVISEGYK